MSKPWGPFNNYLKEVPRDFNISPILASFSLKLPNTGETLETQHVKVWGLLFQQLSKRTPQGL